MRSESRAPLRLWPWLAALLLAGCSPTPSLAVPPTSPEADRPGLLIPFYQTPQGPDAARLVALKQQHPRVPVWVILNARNGPSAAYDRRYAAGIAAFQAAGIQVLGYVPTGYGQRPLATVTEEAARWRQQYPSLDGVFFDEMAAAPTTLSYYREASSAARREGYRLLIGNPGRAVPVALADTVDVVVSYERPGLPASFSPASLPAQQQGLLAYGLGALDPERVRALAARYRCLYLTDDDRPNPWDALARHADTLATVLDTMP